MNADYFENIDAEDKAYWLGFIWADGHVSIRAPWFLVVQIKDYEHLEKLCSAIEYDGEIKIVSGSGYNPGAIHYRVAFCRKKICSDLNLLGRNNNSRLIPSIPNNLIHHFIRGYFDGDGSVYNSKSSSKGIQYSYLSVSIIGETELMNQFKEIFDNLNISCTYKNTNSENMIYLVIHGGNNLRKFYEFLYEDATVYLDRKYEKFSQLYCPWGERSLQCT